MGLCRVKTEWSLSNTYSLRLFIKLSNSVCVRTVLELMQMSVESWLTELLAHGRSEKSIAVYRSELVSASKTLISMGLSTDPREIDKETIHRMVPVMDLKEDSKRQILRTLGQWVEWETGSNPFREAKILWNRSADKKRVYIEKEDLDAALKVADAREKLVLLLGAKMGLRRIEMTRILISDIHDGKMIIRGKGHHGGKIATAVIPPLVSDAISGWMAVRSSIESDVDELFVTPQGAPIEPGYINFLMKRVSEKAGVEITPHSLRRLFAMTLYYKMEVDILDVSRLMRHESVSTTQIYIREDRQKLDRIALMV